MTIFEADRIRPSADDVALLAEGSLFALRLQAFGPEQEGAVALGLLRDICAMLCEPDGRAEPYVTAQAMCRVAIERLMEIGGSNYEGLQAARAEVSKSLATVFNRDGSRKTATPVDGLIEALNSLPAFPQQVDADSPLGKSIVKLLRSRTAATEAAHSPISALGATQKVLDAVDGLGTTVPETLTVGHPLTVALRKLHKIRSDEEFRRQAVLDRRLEVVGAAYARLREMEEQQGAYRIMQLTTVVHNETGQRPGKAEKAAFKLWTEQYSIGSGVVHPGREASAVTAVAMLHDCLALIQELVSTVVDQAPEWVALGAVTSPTPEQIQKVNNLHNPAAAPYLFTRFVGWEWLEKLDSVRLLPEEGRWPARPYFEHLADENPARLVEWLNKDKHLETIWRSGRGATAELVVLCRHLGSHGSALVASALKNHPVDGVRTMAVYWAQETLPEHRDAAWVEAAVKALSVGSDGSAADSWNIRTVLAQLLETGRTGDPQLAQRVRTGLATVLASHLAVEGVRDHLQISDDLRAPSLAGDRSLTGARLAAAACIEFARIELREARTNLAARTGAWTARTLGGWERERLIAVHLVDAAEIAPTDVSWWRAAFAVLARLGTMAYLTPDVGRFVQVAIGTCEPADQADLEAALTEGFGPAPGPEALRAARAELADDDARLARTIASVLGAEALAELLGEDAADMPDLELKSALQPVWRTVYCLSEVAPASVLAPWRPVLDLLAEFTGPPPALDEPLIKIVPYPDHGESTVADFVARCKEHGVQDGAAELSARTPSQGDYYKRMDLRMLEAAVHAEPAAWAADISAVAATLSSFDLRTVYLQTLNTDQQQAGLAENDGRLLTNACTAAWDLKDQLEAGDGSADPDIDERARYIVAQLLRQAWALGADPGVDEATAVTWLMAAVRAWTAPTSVPDTPYATASATSGGLALVALLQWSVRRAADHGELPAEAATQLTELVTDGRDDRALAAIGAALTPLRHYALPWYTAHQATLLDLAAPSAPVHTWLRSLRRLGADEFAVFGDLDPGKVMDYLRADAPEEVFDRFAAVLLHSPGTFDLDFLATLISGDGGPAAVSTLLGNIARALPLEDVAGPLSLHQRAFQLWDQALDLVDGEPALAPALVGIGHFAFAEGTDQHQWLTRTLRTVTATPKIKYPDRVAQRAARSAQDPDALRILTTLVAGTGGSQGQIDYRAHAVIRAAQDALDTSEPGTEGRADLGQALGRYANDVERATAW
ncbi:hypothetical protein [Streptomyces microflavus]|uniref:hypothetical protein n=1 Tax=Streptomyces microflavus TaxID=1919 RepID=UPI002E3425CB|nr:hypothetical protein [Streptomyces microflavus]